MLLQKTLEQCLFMTGADDDIVTYLSADERHKVPLLVAWVECQLLPSLDALEEEEEQEVPIEAVP
jgi:hypothetical protein